MIKGDTLCQEDKIVREHAKFADVYRASLGRHVTEERTKAYMENMTKTGSDLWIRPVACSALKGRKHTAIPDNSLGIGRLAKERPDIVAKKAGESNERKFQRASFACQRGGIRSRLRRRGRW